MFRRLVATTTQGQAETWQQRADKLFRAHPSELAALLEFAWALRKWVSSHEPGHPNRPSDIPPVPDYLLKLFQDAFDKADITTFMQGLTSGNSPQDNDFFGLIAQKHDSDWQDIFRWDHLIYAYLIENTRVFEIFRRVLHEYRHGERLGAPSDGCVHWLRNTEELFFRDPAPFSIYSVVSHVRSDLGASRRNAYYRMFGMDLNHGLDDGKPYPYIKTETANKEFVSTLEEFLREVWVGIENAKNESGANPKDDAAIANLASRLHAMLQTRRQYGNLSQEEFFFVSTMAWFHLSLEYNSPIVKSLKAEANSEEERLKKIAERVKLPAHGQSFYFFRLADALSPLLIQIETGVYNDANAVPALYTPGPVASNIATIITNWSSSTGRNLKKKPVTVSEVR